MMTATLTAALKTTAALNGITQFSTDASGADPAAMGPMDVLCGALATCTASMISFTANRKGIDVTGLSVQADKIMSQTPHRLASITVHITCPTPIAPADRAVLEGAAKSCPVKQSLHPDIAVTLTFDWA